MSEAKEENTVDQLAPTAPNVTKRHDVPGKNGELFSVFEVDRDNAAPFSFVGYLIKEVTGSHWDCGKLVANTISLFKTIGERYVCSSYAACLSEGDPYMQGPVRANVWVCLFPKDVIKFFGWTPAAKKLYQEIGYDIVVDVDSWELPGNKLKPGGCDKNTEKGVIDVSFFGEELARVKDEKRGKLFVIYAVDTSTGLSKYLCQRWYSNEEGTPLECDSDIVGTEYYVVDFFGHSDLAMKLYEEAQFDRMEVKEAITIQQQDAEEEE